jgi:hypothetical protein
MSIKEALKLLKEYGCIQPKIATSLEEKEELRQAILLVNHGSESINLGICADNVEDTLKTLTEYLQALGYSTKVDPPGSPLQGGIYLKYNTLKQTYYLDSYTGTYRGVLISCQSENDTLVGTYGHFPLDLFS